VSYHVVFANQALKDLKKIQRSVYSQTVKRLVEVIQQNPFQTPPP
jgi:mRNA-degrading endonuclease RelE of RelBE toxin-antitoxin system